MRVSDWRIGDVVLDNYTVERHLGKGGMGTVYLLRSKLTGLAFAVKRCILGNDIARRKFMLELLRWFDLPEHPNLVSCRFFRTIETETAIFAEFISGGSLADWIQRKKITQLQQMLDIAIQVAWSIEVIHQLEAVHQDIKPGNVLLNEDCTVKLNDFGLAKARVPFGRKQDMYDTWRVSTQGMTLAYRSPEQAMGESIGPPSDMWSWGVSVLEMFAGEVFWIDGQSALMSLEACLTRRPRAGLPSMPKAVEELLRRCFRQNPGDRWPSMMSVVDRLREIYASETKQSYFRQMIPTQKLGSIPDDFERWSPHGTRWRDPRYWLEKAIEADEGNSIEVEQLLFPACLSRKARTIADLAGYEEALRILERLVPKADAQILNSIAMLCVGKSMIHRAANDLPGALQLSQRAIRILEPLGYEDPVAQANLAIAHNHRGLMAAFLEDNKEALVHLDSAIGLHQRSLANSGGFLVLGDNHVVEDYLDAYSNKALVYRNMGKSERSLTIYQRLIETITEFRDQDIPNLEIHLAHAVRCAADLLHNLHRYPEALELFDQCIQIREKLTNESESELNRYYLARAYIGKGTTISRKEGLDAASPWFQRGVDILSQLHTGQGQVDTRLYLADAYGLWAGAYYFHQRPKIAMKYNKKALEIIEPLVEIEGRHELAKQLVQIYHSFANSLNMDQQFREAALLYDRGIGLMARIEKRNSDPNMKFLMVDLYQNKANALSSVGKFLEALKFFDFAMEALKPLQTLRVLPYTERLVEVIANKASALQQIGKPDIAIPMVDQAILEVKRVLEATNNHQLRPLLGQLYRKKGDLQIALSDTAAIKTYEQAEKLLMEK